MALERVAAGRVVGEERDTVGPPAAARMAGEVKVAGWVAEEAGRGVALTAAERSVVGRGAAHSAAEWVETAAERAERREGGQIHSSQCTRTPRWR